MTDAVLVINAGSTSLKFAVYRADTSDALPILCRGEIDEMQDDARFTVVDPTGKAFGRRDWGKGHALGHKTALHFVVTWLEANMDGLKLIAAGHRIVLSGERFEGPVLIDGGVLDYLGDLAAIEPSHQKVNVTGARAIAELFPHLPQVACFDNTFHRTLPKVAQTYALPEEVRDAGVRHWGYHGISFDYIARRVAKTAPAARRVIMAHLGGGASLCAMLDGKSIETTMGFAGLSGLTMATRSGDVPPEVLFYLLRAKLFDVASLEEIFYQKSGLLGLSGTTGDMKTLQDSDDPRAVAAVDHFVYSMTKFAGAYASVLGGLDAFVFTGGIGEHSVKVRAALCARLAWLGLNIDAAANAVSANCISTPDSHVSVWVIPTDEEFMIAHHTWNLVKGGAKVVADA